MKFVSTRGQSPAVTFGAALAQGLAPDGGLYMPEAWPVIPLPAFDGARTLPEVAEVIRRRGFFGYRRPQPAGRGARGTPVACPPGLDLGALLESSPIGV